MLNHIKSHIDLDKFININPYNTKNYQSLYLNEIDSNGMENILVYLKCKITKKQMERPSRGKFCLHLDCVEFEIFFNYFLLKK